MGYRTIGLTLSPLVWSAGQLFTLAIFKDQSLEKCLPSGPAKKGMVLVFGHINADEQILCRSPNLFPVQNSRPTPSFV